MFRMRANKRSPEELRAKFTKLGVDEIDFCVEDELDKSANPRLEMRTNRVTPSDGIPLKRRQSLTTISLFTLS